MKYQAVADALAELSAAHPEVLDRRAQPIEASPWAEAPPTDKTELHRKLTGELALTVGALTACEAHTSNWDDQRRWDQLAGAISAVVQEWPGVGIDLLDAIGAGHAAVDDAVVRGWAMSNPDDELAARILDRLAELELEPILGSVTSMLGGYRISGADPVEWFKFPQSDAVAQKCWENIAPTTASSCPDADDCAMRSFNHPAGPIAEFWVEKIGHLWRVAGDNWKGIPPEIADYLAEWIAEETLRSEAVEITFCRYLYFFHQADKEWCRQYLIPLFDWDNNSHAPTAWSGFLSHGGWTNALLSDGFLEKLVSTAAHSDQLDKQGQRNLPRLLAKIAVAANIDPRSWIRDLITKSSVSDRVVWTQAIRFQIDSLDADAVEKQWERWMHDYVSDRVSSVPRQLDPAEASAIAGWIPFLTDSMGAAIDLLLQVDTAGFSAHDLFLHDLKDDQIERAPEKIAQLVHHLLKSTSSEFFGGHRIEEIYKALVAADVSETVLHQIAEEALRFGIALN